LVLLGGVAVYTAWNKNLGMEGRPDARISLKLARGLGGIIGFYDGFFGPGTGSFLVFSFISLAGLDFLKASASAKLVNLSTNLAALTIFIPTHHVWYSLAFLMAFCNMAGAWLGARMAIRRGVRLIRMFFLCIVVAFILKLAWDL